MTGTARPSLIIPELGPALGRLVAPPPVLPGSAPPWVPVDDLRILLVSQVFDHAGDARRWAREGDRELALTTLTHTALEEVWVRTVRAVAERVAQQVNLRLAAAAAEARLPARHARRLPLEPSEVHAIAARLSQGDAGFREALGELDRALSAARSQRAAPDAVAAWQEALLTLARRLEAAWLALEDALAREGREWDAEAEDLRRWRRAGWPLTLVGVLLFGAALYLGLVLGGYVPVPAPLRPAVEALWARWT